MLIFSTKIQILNKIGQKSCPIETKMQRSFASKNEWRFGNSQFLLVWAHPHLIWIIEKNGTLKLLSPVDVNSYLWIYQDRFKNWVLKLILRTVINDEKSLLFSLYNITLSLIIKRKDWDKEMVHKLHNTVCYLLPNIIFYINPQFKSV